MNIQVVGEVRFSICVLLVPERIFILAVCLVPLENTLALVKNTVAHCITFCLFVVDIVLS